MANRGRTRGRQNSLPTLFSRPGEIDKNEEQLLASRKSYLKTLQSTDDYSELSFSPQEARQIRRKLAHLSTGAFAALPLICPGASCEFKHNCPLLEMGKAPLGKSCIIESNLLREWAIQFMEEYDVDPSLPTERMFIQALAETELLLYRVNSFLAKPEYAPLVGDSYADIDREGNIIYERKVDPLLEAKEKIEKRKDRIIKLMVGDREGKYKKKAALKEPSGEDASRVASALRRELEPLIRKELGDQRESLQGGSIEIEIEEVSGEEGKQEGGN